MSTTTQPETYSFTPVQPLIRSRFAELLAAGAFVVDYDRDKIWEAYINAFPEELRQEHNCNSCKAFIRQAGALVGLDANFRVRTLWQPLDGAPEALGPGLMALHEYVMSRPIAGLFFHDQPSVGVEKNRDKEHNIVWTHFHAPVPKQFVNNASNKLGKASAEVREDKNVFKRGLDELKPDALQTVMELIGQDSLVRGQEFKHAVEDFQKQQQAYMEIPEEVRDNYCWATARRIGSAKARVRNSAIGTLLIDLSEGRDLEGAVASYEQKVGGANYKRTTALVTPRMIENAKKRLEELGLMSALDRRRLDSRDLTVANAAFVYRPTTSAKDVFAEIADDAPVQMQTLEKVERIGIDDFMTSVLPTAKRIRVLIEREHMGNFVTLTGAVDPAAKNLMKWDNSFSFSYAGGVASPIKERVKREGGRVDGWLRASLAWHNHDDLDLHFRGAGEHVYYGNKRGKWAWLDVDMNAGHGTSREPVENITFDKQLPAGDYEIVVNQYSRREERDTGFEVEIEVNGSTFSFGSPTSPRTGPAESIGFRVDKDGNVSIKDCKLSKSSSGMVKWGVKTGTFVPVKAITLSPNHWTKPVGLKHWFFLLEGCLSDEQTRPFYNEHLCAELATDRKVTEVLAGKIQVAPAEGAELSGLGFAESDRHHVYVEVEGQFKRTLKVVF